MHVLIIPSEAYLSQESPLSGIFQKDQAHALKRAGHTVGVISLNLHSFSWIKNKSASRVQGLYVSYENGIPCYKYHSWNWFSLLGNAATWLWVRVGMRLFRRYVSETGMPDLVHAHNAILAGQLANCIQMRFGIPYVITEHSSDFARGSLSMASISKIEMAYKNAAMLITVSESLGNILESQFGGVVQPRKWIPNILDSVFQGETAGHERGRRKGNVFTFLNVGSLEEIKGHSRLLKAFAEKFRGERGVQLRIGGDGSLRKRLERLAEELDIAGQVRFLGYLSRKDVLHEMKECDVFVVSSTYETFGVVLIEALSCGKPVISTACGGPESIINDHNGVLVPVKDIDALGQAMVAMLDRIDTYDNKRISRECIARFGEEAVVKQISEVYSSLACR